jgi:hypothetical protein
MKNKAIKGFNMATFAASAFFVFAMAVSSAKANAAQPINVTGTASFHQTNYIPGYNNYAYRCYKRCWVNRYGRHCTRTCN